MRSIAATVLMLLVCLSSQALAQTCPGGTGGCFDPTFGGGNLLRVSGAGGYGGGIIRQADGKLITLVRGGNIADGQTITRLLPDGSVDTDFGGSGTLHYLWKLVQGRETYYGAVWGIAIQQVGGVQRILVAGKAPILSGKKVITDRLRIDCLLPDGSSDPSWGTNGTLQLSLNGARAVAVQFWDQSIVLGTDNNNQLIRLTAGGNLDPTFGSGGGASSVDPVSINFDAQHRILAVGQSVTQNRGATIIRPTLTRHNTNGSLDAAFGSNGTVLGGWDARYISSSVSVDLSGHVIISGSAGPTDATTDFIVERFTNSGLPDSSFSGDGMATVDFNGQRDLGMAAAPQSDGRIVIVGNTAVSGTTNGSDIAMARLDYSGNLDATFGTNGKVIMPHTPLGEAFAAVLMVSDPSWADERFYAAGGNVGARQLLVARFLEH